MLNIRNQRLETKTLYIHLFDTHYVTHTHIYRVFGYNYSINFGGKIRYQKIIYRKDKIPEN